MPNSASAWLTQEEMEKVLVAALRKGAKTEAELTAAVRWAEGCRVGAECLAGVLAGQFGLIIEGDEVQIYERVSTHALEPRPEVPDRR